LTLNPVNGKATVVGDVYLSGHDRKSKTVSMSDPKELFFLSKALDVINANTTAHVTLIVRSPILHEVADILDVDASTWHLPEPGV
jgi:hypothetical protein